ncbi:hypothetical protein Tco_0758693 [Tanacetum coccineum]
MTATVQTSSQILLTWSLDHLDGVASNPNAVSIFYDILVMCYGNANSVIVIKETLELFSKISGLKPNMNKSTIFFSNMDMGEKCIILDILPFYVGTFPTRYLGVTLITKRLCKTERKQLVDKVKKRIGDWKNKFLSYAGRVQLIAYVLSSMHIYWAYIFLLLKSNVKDIERVLKAGYGRLCSISEIITNRDICDARFDLKAIIADMITNGQWIWNDEWQNKFPNICSVNVHNLTNEKDTVVWKSKNGSIKKFSVEQVWEDYNENTPNVNWGKLKFLKNIKGADIPNDWLNIIDMMANKFQNKSIKSVLSKIVLGAVVWQERNKRQFTNEKRTVEDLSGIILNIVRLKLSSIKVIKTVFVESVEKD